jgi:hypothetical protein
VPQNLRIYCIHSKIVSGFSLKFFVVTFDAASSKLTLDWTNDKQYCQSLSVLRKFLQKNMDLSGRTILHFEKRMFSVWILKKNCAENNENKQVHYHADIFHSKYFGLRGLLSNSLILLCASLNNENVFNNFAWKLIKWKTIEWKNWWPQLAVHYCYFWLSKPVEECQTCWKYCQSLICYRSNSFCMIKIKVRSKMQKHIPHQ